MVFRSLQQKLVSFWFFLTDSRYRSIHRSGIFDEAYYCANNPDLIKSFLSPLAHYVSKGWREDRNPNPNLFFDLRFYLSKYPEIAEKGVEPLAHYLHDGWRQGYVPSPHFLPEYYLAQKPLLNESVGNPLVYYLRQGCSDNRKAIPYFDPEFYRQSYPDAAQRGVHPHYHYLTIGSREKRRPSPFFDTDWYLDRTPVLRALDLEPVTHYMEYGAEEGKSPLPLFDPEFYRQQNPDIASCQDVYAHYLTFGMPADRAPSRWFDPVFYRHFCADRGLAGLPPLQHYLQTGVYERAYTDARVQMLAEKPLISIVVPVYNVERHTLNNCIRSVLYQAYPHWELCLADDCSSQPHVRQVLEKWAQRDPRIKVTFLESNQGISGATNAAAALANGEYIGFLDNDDELTVDCLYQVAKMIGETGAELLYTDEDLIGDDGRRFSCFYKPGLNKELLLGHNYIVHLVVTSRGLFDLVGGFDCEFDGAQDYDLVLKLSERARKIVHIPQILYHWRATKTSTSINHEQKSYADEAGRKALVSALERRGIEAEVKGTEWKFYYQVQRKLLVKPLVSIFVSWADEVTSIVERIRLLLTVTDYEQFEICVMVKGAENMVEGVERSLSALGENVVCLFVPEKSSQAEQYTLAVRQSRGAYLVFLDPLVTVTSSDWLNILLAHAQYPDTGVVSAQLNALPGVVGEIATIPDITNASPTYYLHFVQGCSVHMNGLKCSQNVWAVSWELCMVSREHFYLCDGFDEKKFPSLFWGLDFCLRLYHRGYENVYLASVIGEKNAIQQRESHNNLKLWNKERTLFQERWRDLLAQGDPYYHISVMNGQIDLEDFIQWYAGAEKDVVTIKT